MGESNMENEQQANPTESDKNPVDSNLPTNNIDSDHEGDSVDYKSHRKLLDEKKKAKAQLNEANAKIAEFEAERKAREEQELLSEKKYTELLAKKEEELADAREILRVKNDNEIYQRKMHAFLSGLGHSKLDAKYYQLVDVDTVKIGEDGAIDQESVASAVTSFRSEHSRILVEPRNDLPANSPGSTGGGSLSYAEWKNLGSSKEQCERWKEVNMSTMP
jgi:hypothetical protein